MHPLWIRHTCFAVAALLLSACGEDPKPSAELPEEQSDLLDQLDEQPEQLEVDEPEVVVPDSEFAAPIKIAFAYRDPDSPADMVKMYLLDSSTQPTTLSQNSLVPLTVGIDCDAGLCMVSSDLSFFIYHTGTKELRIAPIKNESVSAADLQLLASSVDSVQLAGRRLAYVTNNTAFYLDLAQGLGSPAQLATVLESVGDGIDYVGAGVAIGERGEFMLIYRFDRGSLAVFRVPLAGGDVSFLFRLGMPRGSGSQFSNKNPIVVSQDGSTAVALVEGLMLYDICSTNQACGAVPDGLCAFFTNDQGVQSSNGLCAASQRSLQSFALDTEDLGQRCSNDDDCDPRHQCAIDPSSLIGTPQRWCLPRRHIIAPRSPLACDIVDRDGFADVLSKLRISHDDQVFFLGFNGCYDPNVGRHALSSIDFRLSPESEKRILGPYEHDWGQRFCYDEQEDRWDYQACAIELQDFDLAPNGGLVLRASGVNDRLGRELWLIQKDGSKYPATNDIFYEVASLFATSAP